MKFNKMKSELAKELKTKEKWIAKMISNMKEHEDIEDVLMSDNKKLEKNIEEMTGRKAKEAIPGYKLADA